MSILSKSVWSLNNLSMSIHSYEYSIYECFIFEYFIYDYFICACFHAKGWLSLDETRQFFKDEEKATPKKNQELPPTVAPKIQKREITNEYENRNGVRPK